MFKTQVDDYMNFYINRLEKIMSVGYDMDFGQVMWDFSLWLYMSEYEIWYMVWYDQGMLGAGHGD